MERGDLPQHEPASGTDPAPAHPGTGADDRDSPVVTAPEIAAAGIPAPEIAARGQTEPGRAPPADGATHPGIAAVAPAAPATTVFICTTCRAPDADTAGIADGATLAEAALAACPDDVAVKGVRCLANCKRALSAAIVRPDGWTYVFGDLTPAAAPDLIAGARLLAAAPEGVMPWRGRPDSLKRGMVARIPPLSLTEET